MLIMDKNKTILLSVLAVCTSALIGFLGYLFFLHNKLHYVLKNDNRKTEVYSEYTFCIRSAMEKSKDNGKPAALEDAERVCSRFNHSGRGHHDEEQQK